jgi:hypothetical protein
MALGTIPSADARSFDEFKTSAVPTGRPDVPRLRRWLAPAAQETEPIHYNPLPEEEVMAKSRGLGSFQDNFVAPKVFNIWRKRVTSLRSFVPSGTSSTP